MAYLYVGAAKPKLTAAADDGAGPAIKGGLLRKTDDRWELVTTDSFVCAVVQLSISTDDGPDPVEGWLPPPAVRRLSRKGAAFRAHADRVEVFDQEATAEGVWSCERDRHVRFPDATGFWPDETNPLAVVRLDAQLLKRLADSLGTNGLCITVFGPRKPVLVESTHGNRGLIMPIAPSDDK